MRTAIQYFYKDVAVEVQGTYRETALIKINAVIVPVPLKLLRINHEPKQTARIRTRQGSSQSAQERQEAEEG